MRRTTPGSRTRNTNNGRGPGNLLGLFRTGKKIVSRARRMRLTARRRR
jgi:hypothetical protein